MNSALYLLPFVAWVGVRRSRLDGQWKTIADAAFFAYVALCLAILIAGARP